MRRATSPVASLVADPREASMRAVIPSSSQIFGSAPAARIWRGTSTSDPASQQQRSADRCGATVRRAFGLAPAFKACSTSTFLFFMHAASSSLSTTRCVASYDAFIAVSPSSAAPPATTHAARASRAQTSCLLNAPETLGRSRVASPNSVSATDVPVRVARSLSLRARCLSLRARKTTFSGVAFEASLPTISMNSRNVVELRCVRPASMTATCAARSSSPPPQAASAAASSPISMRPEPSASNSSKILRCSGSALSSPAASAIQASPGLCRSRATRSHMVRNSPNFKAVRFSNAATWATVHAGSSLISFGAAAMPRTAKTDPSCTLFIKRVGAGVAPGGSANMWKMAHKPRSASSSTAASCVRTAGSRRPWAL
mmetsp:Transcript_30066/g.101363  ORF Transcript_30066/g.101363 Transcript_30066/m.101363 type:complete len:373 (-) Transcript_30066:228-1346(-)